MDSISLNERKLEVVSKDSKSFRSDLGKAGSTNFNKKKNGFRTKRKFNGKGRGVIYLSHIPHGFYEDEMRSYFNQFGKVRATSVARSKKTGRSKGYGFVEFDDEDVAKIAAETMNNYLMYNRIIKCRYIPPEERKGKIFLRTHIAGNYPRKKNRINDSKHKTKALDNLNQNTYLKKTLKKIAEFKKFFDDRGIDFNYKISSETSQASNQITEESKIKIASCDDLNSEHEAEINDQYGILEIDESDQEISFETPPQVKKVIKKSLNSSSGFFKKLNHGNAETEKKNKLVLKDSNLKNTPKEKITKKKKEKVGGLQGISPKSKKLKVKDTLLAKSSKTKKLKSLKRDISTEVKQKKAKVLSIDIGLVKKEKSKKLAKKEKSKKLVKKVRDKK